MRSAPSRLAGVPGFRPLFASSWLFNLTRWGGLFVSSYLVSKLANAPILNQLVGAAVFAPMLLGGIAAGVLSDRLDRHRLILLTQAVLIPVSVLMVVLVQTHAVHIWMVFPFVLAIGVGGLMNMTAQRALLYDTVGPTFASRALTLDNVGMAAASMLSTLVGGALIQGAGLGSAFALVSVALCLSALLVRQVPRPHHASAGPMMSPREHVAIGVALLRRSPPLQSMLGITVVMNFFCFSFIPLVPVMAKHLGADAFYTGFLASAVGLGQLAGGLVLATRDVERRGWVFVAGSVVALCGLGAFAVAPSLVPAFVALFVTGIGQAAFGSMQSLLAIEAAGPGEQGAALGLLSTAIGALPLGMLFVGVSAQWLGAPLALFTSAAGGIAVLTTWTRRCPDVLRTAGAPS